MVLLNDVVEVLDLAHLDRYGQSWSIYSVAVLLPPLWFIVTLSGSLFWRIGIALGT
jgi:hypothetical protein